MNDLVRSLGLAQLQVSKHLRCSEKWERLTCVTKAGSGCTAERQRAQAHPRLGEGVRAILVGRFAELDVVLADLKKEGNEMAEATSSGTAKVMLPRMSRSSSRGEFDAPKDLVFRAWTSPELVTRWWNAKRGEVTTCEIDLRVGGAWRYVMETPDGN